MMIRHLTEEQLHDAVDDPESLPGDAAAHLSGCDECAADVSRLQQLRLALASLPRVIEPPPSLHAAVRSHITPAGTRVRLPWLQLAAAALVLVFASSAVTAMLMRHEGAVATEQAPATAGDMHLVAQQAVEQSYADAVTELERALAEQRSTLSPATIQLLDTNLAVIDAALAEARAALAADPGNAMLNELLRSGYERKLDVLRSVGAQGRVEM